MNLKIDLDKLKSPKEGTFTSVRIGDYQLSTKDEGLVLKKGDKVIAEHKNDDWFLEGYSITSIWKTLENHYQAIMKLQN